jgi:hypothetical protein
MPVWEKKGNGSTLIIRPHQGMGDHIICCGMYRHFALVGKDRDMIVLAHSGSVANNVAFMLSDLPNVCVVDYPDDNTMDQSLACENDCEILRLGASAGEPHFNRWQFDQEFYRQAGLPFFMRFSKFAFPECDQVRWTNENYIFVHDRPDLDARIPAPTLSQFSIVPPDSSRTIFQHRELLLDAKELHCVSSSFAAFADSFDLNGKALFFYPFGREIPRHQNTWQMR